MLALLANRDSASFVPGINDLVYGNEQEGIVGVAAKMDKGKIAIADLAAYKAAKKSGDSQAAEATLARFTVNQEFLGYGYLESAEQTVPPVATTFYSFHIMVFLAGFFLAIFLLYLVFAVKDTIAGKKALLWLGVHLVLPGSDRLPVRLGGRRGRAAALGHPGPDAGQRRDNQYLRRAVSR